MSKCETSFPKKRESYSVGGLPELMYLDLSLTLTFTDAQGFKLFLRVAWEPFEAQFQSIETRFIHHTNIVVRLAGAEVSGHQIHFYKKETQDKQRQEGR